MQNVNEIISRLQSMTVSVVSRKDQKGYEQSRKVSEIVSCVQSGRSSVSRLGTADKILSKWGF